MTDATAYTRHQQESIARAINDYWRFPVAKVNNHNEIKSTLVFGVPPHARNITHPAIIWVHREDNGKWVVRQ